MLPLDRLAYLDAMDVDVWLSRRPVTSVTCAQPHAGESAQRPVDESILASSIASAPETAQSAPTPNSESELTPAAPETLQPPSRASAPITSAGAGDDVAISELDQERDPPPQTGVGSDSGTQVSVAEPTSTVVTLESLQTEAAACQRCELHKTRLQSVFGHGNPAADWMFVGEAPGAEEDRQGLPFVGPAGKLLDAMLVAIGLAREDVYIANLVKCRPPRNRDPQPHELVSCQSYIGGQLEIVQPRIIVALGRFAAQSLTKSTESIGRLRGSTHTHESGIPVVATYHPAYLLRSPAEKGKVWRDLLHARTIVTAKD